ncbi:MAG TPA: PQQ-dependent sugar dehydrogenase [Acidimicrobiia bacterium]|nr:PQQ-dependent sugar dehydrogenase [Acidimicrobiia bacterium]
MRRALVGMVVVVAAYGCSSSNTSSSAPGTTAKTSPAPTTTSTTRKSAATTSTTTAPNLDAVRISLAPVAQGLSSPVAIAWRKGDDHMYVAEQTGTVRVVTAAGRTLPTPALTVNVSHGNEQGLLGLTFSPDGRKMYVHYDDPAGDSHIVEFRMAGLTVDASTRREVLFQDQPFPNHNGGEVITGPDGMLYIGFGDGGSEGDPNNNGQNLNTFLGKILRIDPSGSPYSVPKDNPFVGRSGARSEIWMYGLRNPWRFTFDRATGDVWIGDVGQNLYEEIDYAPAEQSGINWGWSQREGFHSYKGDQPAGARDPLLETTHSDGNCAIVGGYVYRGTRIPNFNGVYIYGDNCKSDLVGVVQRGGHVQSQRVIGSVDSLTSFGEGPDGELYALSRAGTVFRITAS